MAVDHYMVCDKCRSAWEFFRSRAGGFSVAPPMMVRPEDFWKWMTAHRDHGITVTDEHGLDEREHDGEYAVESDRIAGREGQ